MCCRFLFTLERWRRAGAIFCLHIAFSFIMVLVDFIGLPSISALTGCMWVYIIRVPVCWGFLLRKYLHAKAALGNAGDAVAKYFLD